MEIIMKERKVLCSEILPIRPGDHVVAKGYFDKNIFKAVEIKILPSEIPLGGEKLESNWIYYGSEKSKINCKKKIKIEGEAMYIKYNNEKKSWKTVFVLVEDIRSFFLNKK